jgi:hypothetical protein
VDFFGALANRVTEVERCKQGVGIYCRASENDTRPSGVLLTLPDHKVESNVNQILRHGQELCQKSGLFSSRPKMQPTQIMSINTQILRGGE